MSAKIRVLVIDDEAAILRFLKPALEANNYEMTSAGTIAEGIKRIAAETPDVVLLDLGLPDGDGKDIIRRAREWSDLPIIVLSARERETEKIESLDLGADDYVNKPFNVGELLARMRAALRQIGNSRAAGRKSRSGRGTPSCEPCGRRAQAHAKGI
jgi:two-component system KDP operon response regulator KdpE